MRIIISPWGHPGGWREVRYIIDDDGDYGYVSSSSYIALLRHYLDIGEEAYGIIAVIDSLANREEILDAEGERDALDAIILDKVVNWIRELGGDEEVVRHTHILILPAVGSYYEGKLRFKGRHNIVNALNLHILSFYSGLLSEILELVLNNSPSSLDLHLDFTHGHNYQQIVESVVVPPIYYSLNSAGLFDHLKVKVDGSISEPFMGKQSGLMDLRIVNMKAISILLSSGWGPQEMLRKPKLPALDSESQEFWSEILALSRDALAFLHHNLPYLAYPVLLKLTSNYPIEELDSRYIQFLRRVYDMRKFNIEETASGLDVVYDYISTYSEVKALTILCIASIGALNGLLRRIREGYRSFPDYLMDVKRTVLRLFGQDPVRRVIMEREYEKISSHKGKHEAYKIAFRKISEKGAERGIIKVNTPEFIDCWAPRRIKVRDLIAHLSLTTDLIKKWIIDIKPNKGKLLAVENWTIQENPYINNLINDLRHEYKLSDGSVSELKLWFNSSYKVP